MKPTSIPFHLGEKIFEVFNNTKYSVNEFADLIGCKRTNIYSIFQRKSLDTNLLVKISEVLRHDFFQYYTITSKKKCNQDDSFTINLKNVSLQQLDDLVQLLNETRLKMN